MEELKKFYGLTEFLFYLFWFMFFLIWIFIRNNFYSDIVSIIFKFIDIPFVIIAICYWLLTIKFRFIEEWWEDRNYDVLNATLILIWASALSIIIFLQFAFPDII